MVKIHSACTCTLQLCKPFTTYNVSTVSSFNKGKISGMMIGLCQKIVAQFWWFFIGPDRKKSSKIRRARYLKNKPQKTFYLTCVGYDVTYMYQVPEKCSSIEAAGDMCFMPERVLCIWQQIIYFDIHLSCYMLCDMTHQVNNVLYPGLYCSS